MEVLIQHWHLALGCFVAGYLLAAWVHGRHRAVSTPLRADIDDADIRSALDRGHRIQAIRLYRQRTGAELREAARAVDAMREHAHHG